MENIQEKIESYLDGKMNAQDLAKFETQLANDPVLSNELEMEQVARNAVRAIGRSDMAKRLEKLEEEVETPVRSINRVRKGWLMAASILLLAIAGYWFLQPKTSNPDDLFAAYFEPYRSPVQVRGSTDNTLSNWAKAAELYEQKDFDQAISFLQKVNAEGTQPNYLVQFYIGVALLSKNNPNPPEAIKALNQVSLSQNNYRQQADWYIALAYLQMNQTEQAIPVLEGLMEKNDFKKREVKELLEMLKE